MQAFKEWALVCDELLSGRVSVLLRKGGIHEGRDGFRFEHGKFYFFPTYFHEQVKRLKVPADTPLPPREEGTVVIRGYAEAEWSELVTDEAKLRALGAFHPWADEVVEERFRYGEPPGIHVAFLRVYRLAEPWRIADEPKYGGCRSWVALPVPPEGIAMEAVLDDAAHAARAAEIRRVLG